MDLIKTFLYFAVFKHPLTREEALNFCQYPVNSIDESLNELVQKELLFKIDSYYLPHNSPEWVRRRQQGNQLSQKKMLKAKRMARILSRFPFVRSVMISGSLSKGYMDKKSDIDFFVIMKPGSIAISKFLMGLFRRFFAPKSFCINFMIDVNQLRIEKQNLYTAIEMVTLIPMVDDQIYDRFMTVNSDWVQNFLPNASLKQNRAIPFRRHFLQAFVEWILRTRLLKLFDEKLRSQYGKRLRKVASNETLKSGDVVIHKGVIKLHSKPYQQKIMHLYKQYQEDFSVKTGLVFERSFYD